MESDGRRSKVICITTVLAKMSSSLDNDFVDMIYEKLSQGLRYFLF